MKPISRRIGVGVVLFGLAGTAAAQTVAPPNVHLLVDTSGSMRELPQLMNGNHAEFFAITTNGCVNPRLDAAQSSRGWDPNTVYPVPDMGTGVGSDLGFPNLFQDSKFYGYMYWTDSTNPTPQWNTKEEACQLQVPEWSGARAADYQQCLSCLSTKGYYKLPEAEGYNSGDVTNRDFIFWGRFLNFNPPKHVAVRVAVKQVLEEVMSTRVGYSHFINTTPNSLLAQGQKAACDVARTDPNAFELYRASYINGINSLTFTTGTPLARSLLNIGYYFTSDAGVYRDVFGFGSYYNYPTGYQNAALTSQLRSVCWGCQHSAAIIITDGEPTGDSLSSGLASKLRTLNGGPVYCPDTEPCGPGPISQRDKGTDPANVFDDNANYYLDDVAKLLSTRDLQRNTPDVVGDFDTSGQQSLTVHTVGYGWNSNLLKNTAAVGGGLYYTADHPAALKQALQAILANVQTRAATCTLP
jgi:type IV pilus assembly protein PilY1